MIFLRAKSEMTLAGLSFGTSPEQSAIATWRSRLGALPVPRLPRRLQIEGYAIAEFEVSADGRAKNIHLVDAWPSDVFFASAKEALEHARFQPSLDEHVRYGASYRMPFVFRLNGLSQLPEKGERAKTLRPVLHAAQRFVESLSALSDEMRARSR